MLRLEKRTAPSLTASVISPVIAITLTVICGLLMIQQSGKSPAEAFDVYFLFPLNDLISFFNAPAGERGGFLYQPAEVLVKAIPLALIGLGLSIVFKAGLFNIGAPGQYIFGAVFAGAIALHVPNDLSRSITLPLCLVAGAVGGLLWAVIPAFLRIRCGASEILTSLMLTYVAALYLDWLIRNPWKDPLGFGFPQTADFPDNALMPVLLEGTRLHWGIFIVLIIFAALWIMQAATVTGFRITVTGLAPKAARFAGFNEVNTVYIVFMISGALAGLAGAIEATATIGQLQPEISADYGFAAIIVAFLGRLHPLGILLASIVLAITYIGGENAQILLGLPKNATLVFQGMLLFFLLACDALIHYRLHWQSSRKV